MDKYTDRELFALSRLYPGKDNPQYAYVEGKPFSKSEQISTGFSVNTVLNISTGNLEAPGTTAGTYLVLMSCPSLGVFSGSLIGDTGSYGKQLSGVSILQGTIAQTISYYEFIRNLSSNYTGLTSLQAYNYECTTSLIPLTYSSCYSFKLVVPNANYIGTCYEGIIPISQLLPDGTGTAPNPTVTVQQLIQMARTTHEGENSYKLCASISNDQILAHGISSASASPGVVVTTNRTPLLFASEVIHYMVFQTPAMSITTGSTYPYSLMGHWINNVSILPYMNDSIIFNTFAPPNYIDGSDRFKDVNIIAKNMDRPMRYKKVLEDLSSRSATEQSPIESIPKELAPLNFWNYVRFLDELHTYKELMKAEIYTAIDSDNEVEEEKLLGKGSRTILNMSRRGISIIAKENPNVSQDYMPKYGKTFRSEYTNKSNKGFKNKRKRFDKFNAKGNKVFEKISYQAEPTAADKAEGIISTKTVEKVVTNYEMVDNVIKLLKYIPASYNKGEIEQAPDELSQRVSEYKLPPVIKNAVELVDDKSILTKDNFGPLFRFKKDLLVLLPKKVKSILLSNK